VPVASELRARRLSAGAGKTAAEAEAWLARHGLLTRGVANYGLPDHLRITVGLEQHNRAVVDLLATLLG
jgi:histidinol-phosphate aminotransferase